MISIDRPQFAYLFRVRADVAQKLNSSTSPYFLCKSQGHEGGSRFTTHLHMKGACKDFIGPRLIVFTEIQLIDLNGPSFQLPSFAYHQCRCVIKFNGLQLGDATRKFNWKIFACPTRRLIIFWQQSATWPPFDFSLKANLHKAEGCGRWMSFSALRMPLTVGTSSRGLQLFTFKWILIF